MSRIEVPMPQMGESIAEGTVSKWLKQVGDAVERDEPILEISTDKVDAEIPSPSAGALVEVLVAEGETVEVGTIVAFIDPNGSSDDRAQAAVSDDPAPAGSSSPSAEESAQTAPPPANAEAAEPSAGATSGAAATDDDPDCTTTTEERLRARSTPVVRRIAAEAGIEIAEVPGTGHGGRVTKQDILAHIEKAPAERVADPVQPAPQPSAPTPSAPAPTPAPTPAARPAPSGDDLWDRFSTEVEHPVFPVRAEDTVEAMDKVRRLTAEHMILAKRVHAHVHSIVEIDFTSVDTVRREMKEQWAKRGARVSYTAFVAWACSRILRDFPTVNGVISGDSVIHRGAVNLGMAVDLNPGLIVPVIHDADDLGLVGLGKKIVDLATRAKSRRLSPAEIQGATFTITNPGVLGTMVGMPVIPKGTSAILGTGAIEKRVVALTDPVTGGDSVAIRKRSYFSLGYDHRLVDGADSARFLSALKEVLEDFPQ